MIISGGIFLASPASDTAGQSQRDRSRVECTDPLDDSSHGVSYADEIASWEHTLLTPEQRLAVDGPDAVAPERAPARHLTAEEGRAQWERWSTLTRQKAHKGESDHAGAGERIRVRLTTPTVRIDLGVDDTSRPIDDRVGDAWGRR